MAWVKYRHNEASGYGQWEWKFFRSLSKDDDCWVEELLISEYESSGGDTYSHLYRGVEFKVLEKAPKEVVSKELDSMRNKLKNLTDYIAMLEAELKEV